MEKRRRPVARRGSTSQHGSVVRQHETGRIKRDEDSAIRPVGRLSSLCPGLVETLPPSGPVKANGSPSESAEKRDEDRFDEGFLSDRSTWSRWVFWFPISKNASKVDSLTFLNRTCGGSGVPCARSTSESKIWISTPKNYRTEVSKSVAGKSVTRLAGCVLQGQVAGHGHLVQTNA